MGHADGVCAVFLDAAADEATAVRVAMDSKVSVVLCASLWEGAG